MLSRVGPLKTICGILTVVLTAETVLFAVLTAAALDSFVHRPTQGGGSITTLLPGFVYAAATVMKVCVVTALVTAVVGCAQWLFARGTSKRSARGMPVWGLTSITLTPVTPFVGALAVLTAQFLIAGRGVLPADQFPQAARSGVFVMLGIFGAGLVAGVTSFMRRERPSIVPILGLLANVVLVGLFCHLRFYALGFDQDTWAPP